MIEESRCPICSSEMEEIKKKKTHRYKKESTIYECEVCGHQERKRTLNEILRDNGKRN